MKNNEKRVRTYLRTRQARDEYNLPRDRLYQALRSGEITSIDLGLSN